MSPGGPPVGTVPKDPPGALPLLLGRGRRSRPSVRAIMNDRPALSPGRHALAGDTTPHDPGGPSMSRFALALVLAMSTAGSVASADAAKAPSPPDPYLWLEDVTGDKALEWARARNGESAKALETGDFAALEKRILDI